MTLHNIKLNSIYPQSFIQIGPRVSEILKVSPKMNAILTIAVFLHFWLENRWTDSTKLVQIFHRGFPATFICVLSCWRIFSPSISRWEHIEILGNLNSFFSLITFRSDGTFSSGSLRLSSWSFSANIWRLWIQKCNLKS